LRSQPTYEGLKLAPMLPMAPRSLPFSAYL